MAKNNKKQDDYKYNGSFWVKVLKIDIISASNLAMPFYTLEKPNGETIKIGGTIIGKLDEIDDPILEARKERIFINNIGYFLLNGESICEYEHYSTYHKIVASEDCDTMVLIDCFTDGKDTKNDKFCIGSSTYFYGEKDGKLVLKLDGAAINSLGLD